MSGLSVVEVVAIIAIFFIVSASIEIVSNGRATRRTAPAIPSGTNQAEREFHAPAEVIHTYAPRH